MRAHPAFTFAVLATLAIGIGVNTAMFTMVRAVLLRPLPYREPERLVRISEDNARTNQYDVGFNLVRFEEMKKSSRSFSDLGAYFIAREDLTLSGDGDPQSIKVGRVSHDFLPILGVEPTAGRSFLPEEDAPGAPAAVMISVELWQRRFGGDPGIVGKIVNLNSKPAAIVGVMPAGFAFPAAGLDAWVTQPAEYSGLAPQLRRTAGYLVAFGRLNPGVTIEQARAELNVLSRQYAFSHPEDSQVSMHIAFLRDQLVANVREMLWMLFGAAAFVLLIGCANIAGLLLSRAASRSREFAVRAAIGASRGRLVSQLLAESLTLAILGGVIGIVLARWLVLAATHASILKLPRAGEIGLDADVLVFTLVMSIAAGALFGLAPSFAASRPDLMNTLRTGGEGAGSPPRLGWLGTSARGVLVTAQVALSFVLLIGAGLLLKSMAQLLENGTGFRPSTILSAQISLPLSRYDWRKQWAFFDDLLSRVRIVPGIESLAAARTVPMTAAIASPVAIAEQPSVPWKDRSQAQMQTITPDYFRVLGIAVRRGRVFNDRDRPETGGRPVIVNESLARRFWPAYPAGQDPIGQHLLIGNESGGWEIVGIVANVHDRALDREPVPEYYLPMALNVVSTAGLIVRTTADPHRLIQSIRAEVRNLDPDVAISNVTTMEELIGDSTAPRRLTLLLLGSFAGVALLLAMLGIYGIIANSVAERGRELAIRSALGAQRGNLLRLVLSQALTLTSVGLAIGVAGALAFGRLAGRFLYHVSATDPVIFAAIAALFGAVSALAAWLPARSGSRADPASTLR